MVTVPQLKTKAFTVYKALFVIVQSICAAMSWVCAFAQSVVCCSWDCNPCLLSLNNPVTWHSDDGDVNSFK